MFFFFLCLESLKRVAIVSFLYLFIWYVSQKMHPMNGIFLFVKKKCNWVLEKRLGSATLGVHYCEVADVCHDRILFCLINEIVYCFKCVWLGELLGWLAQLVTLIALPFYAMCLIITWIFLCTEFANKFAALFKKQIFCRYLFVSLNTRQTASLFVCTSGIWWCIFFNQNSVGCVIAVAI